MDGVGSAKLVVGDGVGVGVGVVFVGCRVRSGVLRTLWKFGQLMSPRVDNSSNHEDWGRGKMGRCWEVGWVRWLVGNNTQWHRPQALMRRQSTPGNYRWIGL